MLQHQTSNAPCVHAVHHQVKLSGALSKEHMEEKCRLTNYLKNIGKQDELLGRPCSVRQVAEERPGQEAAQAERWQGQTQEVRCCI